MCARGGMADTKVLGTFAERRVGSSPSVHSLDTDRMNKDQCRHCGGFLPCRSRWGDRSIGKVHTWKSYAEMLRCNRPVGKRLADD